MPKLKAQGDEEDPGPDDDRPGKGGQNLVLRDRGPVDGSVLDSPPQAGPADDQTEQAGVDGPLFDPAEEGGHLGRARERAVRGDVEVGDQEWRGKVRDKRLRDHWTSRGSVRDRAFRTPHIVQTDVTPNVTLGEKDPDQG